jgi:acyl-CoA synthetase (AMP-forming)/AMP-acid ligase II
VDAVNPNLAARLAERAAALGSRTAIVEARGGGRRAIGFGPLAESVAALAAGLEDRGVSAGDRVLLFVPMSIDLYVALVAVLHRGAVAVFVDAWAGRARIDAAIRAARPRAFLGTPKSHLLRLVSPALRAVPIKLVADRRWFPLERTMRRGRSRPAALVEGDAPALVTFTTGSTGRPKAAARSHAFLWAQHQALARELAPRPDDVDMPTLPIFVLNNLATGITSVLPDFDPRRPADIDPVRVHRQMVRERVTTTSGSPAFYDRLATWCRSSGERLEVRALFTGGAPVLPPLARRLAAVTAGTVHVVYGSTEAEPIASIEAQAMEQAMADPAAMGLCVGPPVPELELRLVRPHDGPLVLGPEGWPAWAIGPGEVGEVLVSGAHVLPGYLDDPDSDRAQKVRDGARVWHRTGDGARLDASGRLWLMGRVAHRVRRAGQTWWGTAAEVRALRVDGVSHAAYLGLPDGRLGARAVLCVEVPGARLDADRERRLREALAEIPIDDLRGLSRIPRDPRHASKTDLERLKGLLEPRPAG